MTQHPDQRRVTEEDAPDLALRISGLADDLKTALKTPGPAELCDPDMVVAETHRAIQTLSKIVAPSPEDLQGRATDPGPRYVSVTYGEWDASGHVCADIDPDGCEDPVYQRTVTVADLQTSDVVGVELRCPGCEPAADSLAVARVRDLHSPASGRQDAACSECEVAWPCDTIRVLDGIDQ